MTAEFATRGADCERAWKDYQRACARTDSDADERRALYEAAKAADALYAIAVRKANAEAVPA